MVSGSSVRKRAHMFASLSKVFARGPPNTVSAAGKAMQADESSGSLAGALTEQRLEVQSA